MKNLVNKIQQEETITFETEVPNGFSLVKKTENGNWAVLWAGEISYVSSDFSILLRDTDGQDEVEFVEGWNQEWQIVRSDFWKSIKRQVASKVEISLQEAMAMGWCQSGIIGFIKNEGKFCENFLKKIETIFHKEKLNKNEKNIYTKKYSFVVQGYEQYLEQFEVEKIYK